MEHGGSVPTVSLKYTPDKGAHAVLGTGPGHVPVQLLVDTQCLNALFVAAAGIDPTTVSLNYGSSRIRELRNDAKYDDAVTALSDAVDAIRHAHLPGLLFTQDATPELVRESFCRNYLGGTPVDPEKAKLLLAIAENQE